MAGHSLAGLLSALGVTLEREMLERLEWLGRELLRWNRTHNLTAITDLDEVHEKHLADSLTLLPLLGNAHRLLDLGSGAGFPALPLKIACPGLEVVSVDAVGKKVAFQRHVARTLKLAGFMAVHGRAEDLSGHPCCPPGFEVITARALGSLPLLTRLAVPCLAPGGRLIAMKGADGLRELADSAEQLAAAGWTARSRELSLPQTGAGRCLITLQRNI